MSSDPKNETTQPAAAAAEGEEEKVSTHFLVANRELRPEGDHFEAEGGPGYHQKWVTAMVGDNKAAADRPAAKAS
ncbi:hypothetical protein ACA910_013788 [Epithemia clementina (nom. ined.)]